jgi:transcriptional regulator NrdR family protein
MKCPVCKTRFTDVLQTKPTPTKITRVRECFEGHKFVTEEAFVRLVKARKKNVPEQDAP